jgi:hypothetical protein
MYPVIVVPATEVPPLPNVKKKFPCEDLKDI